MILTQSQGERLTRMIAAMRPDFESNGIARILQRANQGDGLPAHDMGHAIRAAAHYTTQLAPDGSHAKHTPAMYPATGQHWDQTAPVGSRHKRHQEPPCEEHPTYDARTCACCWADIKLGERPERMLGKRIHPAGKPNAFGAQAVKQALQALKSPDSDVQASETTRGVAPF